MSRREADVPAVGSDKKLPLSYQSHCGMVGRLSGFACASVTAYHLPTAEHLISHDRSPS